MIFSINASQSSAPVQLRKGCAMTFRAARPGVLRVTSGRVWATMSPQDTRDLVLTMFGTVDWRAAMKAVVPDLRGADLIPGCGHWTQQERPDAVNEKLLAWLKGL